MLTPEVLRRLPNNVVNIMLKLEEDLIKDIARRASQDLQTDYYIQQMLLLGQSMYEIEEKLLKAENLSRKEVQQIMTSATKTFQSNQRILYRAGGKDLPAIDNPAILSFLDGAIERTQGTFRNLGRISGFGSAGRFKPIREYYIEQIDSAILELSTGVADYNTVLRKTIRRFTDGGLRVVHYDSGRVYSVEAATRMNVLTGMSQITGLLSEYNADLMDQDLMEITAHSDARPSHAKWQGEIVSRSGRRGYLSLDDIGYGDVTGFKGANCRHDWFPYFEGVSVEAAKPSHYEPFEYEGKTYDAYEASQRQRYFERNIRKAKREIIAFEAAGLQDDYLNSLAKMNRHQRNYRNFSKKANLRVKQERAFI